MNKFINVLDSSDIRYFQDGLNPSDWVDISNYRQMTKEEVLKFETNPHTDYHVWDEELLEWIDSRRSEQIAEYKRSQYPSLTRYQFLRCLLENGFKASDIEAQIQTIEDEFSRELALLGFKEATNFVRTDESILAMQSVLNLTDERVDQMWEYALTL